MCGWSGPVADRARGEAECFIRYESTPRVQLHDHKHMHINWLIVTFLRCVFLPFGCTPVAMLFQCCDDPTGQLVRDVTVQHSIVSLYIPYSGKLLAKFLIW